MLIIPRLESLALLRQAGGLAPELIDYMEPTLEILEEECPERDPELEGGCFIVYQAYEDLLDPEYGIFYQNLGEPVRLPVAESIEEIATEQGLYFAIFVATDDESGNTHILPDATWLPEPLKAWLREGVQEEEGTRVDPEEKSRAVAAPSTSIS